MIRTTTLAGIIVATFFQTATEPKLSTGVSGEERDVLVALYRATGGPRWAHNRDWLGPPGTECHWEGVSCDVQVESDGPTHVIGLEMYKNNLVGSIPPSLDTLERLGSLNL